MAYPPPAGTLSRIIFQVILLFSVLLALFTALSQSALAVSAPRVAWGVSGR